MMNATKRKREYNKNKYRRYEISVDLDTKLNHLLEEHKKGGQSISSLVRGLLCEYFGVSENELQISHIGDGVKNKEL